MVRTPALRRSLLAACSLLALAGCEQILGFPGATLSGSTGTGGTGGSGTTTTGTGGSGTTTTGTGGSSTTTAGTGGSGGTTTATTGTGGAGGDCNVNATRPCYEGPEGTEGVGLCKAGTQLCVGTTWGACLGAVVPAVEDCTTLQADESCDGLPACGGAYRWAKRFGDLGGQYGNGLAVDSAGAIIVAGRSATAIDFGGGNLVCDGIDAVVAKLDAHGAHLWSKRFGLAGSQQAYGVATASDDSIVLVGETIGGIDFGGGTLTSPTGDGFVAKLDKDGAHLWSRLLSDTGVDAAAVSVDKNGDVLVAGNYKDTPSLGLGAFPAATNPHAFVAKLAGGDGHTLWAAPFGSLAGNDVHTTTALAVDGAGDVVVALNFKGSVIAPFEGQAACQSKGARVVKLHGGTGMIDWAWGTCDATVGNLVYPSALGVDAAGEVFVAGGFTGTIDLGVDFPHASAGGYDVFLVKLGHALGLPQKGATFGDASDQRALSLAVDGAGNVAIAGPSIGTIDFGGGPVATAGHGAFLAKLGGPQLGHLWSRGFSDINGSLAADVTTLLGYRALAALPTGDLAWTTGLSKSTDLGGGMLDSGNASNDLLVALFAP
jgi:hypothetical protein